MNLILVMETIPMEEKDYSPPSYSSLGWIIVEVIENLTPFWRGNDWLYEVIDHLHESSIFWICEHEGFDYWLENCVTFTSPGRYIIRNIHGRYISGDGWTTDDDVEWYADEPERLSETGEWMEKILKNNPGGPRPVFNPKCYKHSRKVRENNGLT